MTCVKENPLHSRADAHKSAAAIRAAIADPIAAGKRHHAHIYFDRKRGGTWIATWSNLPGLTMDVRHRSYTHTLLPGWEYTVAEMRTEMIEDLERCAETGELPKVATR